MRGSRLTSEEFIEKVENLYPNRFRYDKVEYINEVTEVILDCVEHGEFLVKPRNLLTMGASDFQCPECWRKQSFEVFNKRVKEEKGDVFEIDYDSYENGYKGKLRILCKRHGSWFNCPVKKFCNSSYSFSDSNVTGCTECFREKSFKKFLREAEGRKSLLYDYSKVDYINSSSEVEIVCREHGSFLITPQYFLKGGECPSCNLLEKEKRFCKEALVRHGAWNFDYSEFRYTGSNDKGVIICPQHGRFEQTPTLHLSSKTPCPVCRGEYGDDTEGFIKKCKSIFGTDLEYGGVEYINHKNPVRLTCPYHGDFLMTPRVLLKNRTGCPECVSRSNRSNQVSRGEIDWLNGLNVPKRQYLVEGYNVDGYDEASKTVYEFLGDYWHGNLSIYSAGDINKANGRAFGELNSKTFERLRVFKERGYRVIYIWEQDWIDGKEGIELV